MSTLWRVRQAMPDDAPAIGQIRVAAWQAAYCGMLPDDFLDALDPLANVDGLRARLATQSSAWQMWVGEQFGGLAGFVVSGTPRFAAAGVGSVELYARNVHPAAWGKGLAQPLIEAPCWQRPAPMVRDR
jgi:hypothetical protein